MARRTFCRLTSRRCRASRSPRRHCCRRRKLPNDRLQCRWCLPQSACEPTPQSHQHHSTEIAPGCWPGSSLRCESRQTLPSVTLPRRRQFSKHHLDLDRIDVHLRILRYRPRMDDPRPAVLERHRVVRPVAADRHVGNRRHVILQPTSLPPVSCPASRCSTPPGQSPTQTPA